MDNHVEYLPDASIDADTDNELRKLLTTCFTGPQDHVFQQRRYFKEPYDHRWVIRDDANLIVSHIGVHDKEVDAGDKRWRIAGIAEVCVHPDHRGKGYVKKILYKIHDWMLPQEYSFSMLFGDNLVYASSGYHRVENLRVLDQSEWKSRSCMIKPLSNLEWPTSNVRLMGPVF